MSAHKATPVGYGEAIDAVGEVGKHGYNPYDKYSFRRAEDVYQAVQPVLARYGLTPSVDVLDYEHSTFSSAKGTPMRHALVKIRLTLTDEHGASTSIEAIGEGADRGDKAFNKAMTAGMKQALVWAFMIPAGSEDTEESSPSMGKAKRSASAPRDTERDNGARPSSAAVKLAEAIRRAETATAVEAFELDVAHWQGTDRERTWLRAVLDRRIEVLTGEIRERLAETDFPVAEAKG